MSLCLGSDKPVHTDGLQIWLSAEKVKSKTDLFLSTMPNVIDSRYAARQSQIKHRPLFIRDYVEHRPAVSLSDMRGFNFGHLTPTQEIKLYVGYYHKVTGKRTSFRIETFDYDDILAENIKNGFVFAVYDGILAFYGRPGQTATFAELLVYTEKLTEKQDKQIKGYLKARHSLRNDSRHIRSNAAISLASDFASNVVKLSDETLIAAAEIKESRRFKEQSSVELFRSYDHGEKWSQTITQILEAGKDDSHTKPYMYRNPSETIFFIYNKASENGYKIACKSSDDDGFHFSKEFELKNSLSEKPYTIADKILFTGTPAFIIKQQKTPIKLLLAEGIDSANNAANVNWQIRSDLHKSIGITPSSMTTAAFTNYGLKTYCFYSNDEGFIMQSSTEDGKQWTEPKKVRTESARLRNPNSTPLFLETIKNDIYLFFRNQPELKDTSRDTVWLTKGVMKDEQLTWNCPEPVFYSNEFFGSEQMEINSVILSQGKLKAGISCAGSIYFCPVEQLSLSEIVPLGVGVLELKDDFLKQQYYSIPPLPSLVTGSIVIDMNIKESVTDEDRLIFKIGDSSGRIVFFAEDNRFGLFVKDGDYSAVLKTSKFDGTDKRRLTIQFDGKVDIMRIFIDGKMTDWDNEGGQSWSYFPTSIDEIETNEKLFMPSETHRYLSRLGIHYIED